MNQFENVWSYPWFMTLTTSKLSTFKMDVICSLQRLIIVFIIIIMFFIF